MSPLLGGWASSLESRYREYRNSRTYYFIILAHAKLLLGGEALAEFCRELEAGMRSKVEMYKREVELAANRNFLNFRFDEINDIKFATKALHIYMHGRLEDAVEAIYRRDKPAVMKKKQF